MTTKHDLFTQIARKHLGIETLESRHRDSLDFHEVSVVGVQQALNTAYHAGQADFQGLLIAAEALLAAKDNQMKALDAWRRLRRAIRDARKQNTLSKP